MSIGKQIIKLNSEILSSASIVGNKEHTGPLGECFDAFDEKDRFGQDTWERSESQMQKLAFGAALEKNGFKDTDIDVIFAGDLLNQCIAATYGLSDFDTSFVGLYGACSTAAESMMLASIMTSYGIYKHCGAVTSSHFCAAEVQFRTPLEYGGQRPQSSQWTVTGSGAFIIGKADDNACDSGRAFVVESLAGKIVDMGVKDGNNMGCAMAPSAASTLTRYFAESKKDPSCFDMIITGDLGFEGSEMLCDLMRSQQIDISGNHNDCGMMIYDRKKQDVHSGGSGCGCSAVVMASYIIPKIRSGEINDVLFLGTGALMSPSSIKQGQAIPGIAHLLHISSKPRCE